MAAIKVGGYNNLYNFTQNRYWSLSDDGMRVFIAKTLCTPTMQRLVMK